MPRPPPSRKTPKGSNSSQRHDPLHHQLKSDELVSRFGSVSAPGRRAKKSKREHDHGDGDSDDDPAADLTKKPMITGAKAGGGKTYVDPKLSRNILRLAREQQDELEAEELESQRQAAQPSTLTHAARATTSAGVMPDDSDDEAMGSDDDKAELDEDDEARDGWDREWNDYEADLDIDPSDRALLEKFQARQRGEAEEDQDTASGVVGSERRGNKTLADMIMDKINAADTSESAAGGPERPRGEGMMMPPGMSPKVIEVYTKVGELLSRYKSGPLPKAFKIIPSLPSWESILYITDPEMWTPHALLAATRIFVSNLKSDQTQRFYELVLLDKVRNEIEEHNKVSYQTYEAIKKALYKPAAFFKGFLFPLCESGTLTLKEAAIVSSVLSKISIPVLHSAAALLRLAEMEYSGPTSLFIRVLLDKKYALPYKVVDSLVFHFLKFADENEGVEVDKYTGEKRMPVLWHQSLLVFAQRYKQDLTPDQKGALLDLLRVQKHDGISPEVRRELMTGEARGEMLEEPVDEDDDMSI
ncbi:Bystin-domain-containing protein [Violaceomyces palustris]|uniref:Bystin-domain-containing protein n=1 Tax=Violaceomyces palustris TaxID=1673888 RepID=A0ACD0P1U4_9BASI|nr:Bystin-domain-containing protein [Violaceomyces palustris]